MFKNKLFKHAFGVLILFGLLIFMADKLYLYWTVIWMDLVMHFLGGVWVVLVILWIWSIRKNFILPNKTKTLKICIVGVMIVGLLWEVYELLIGAVRPSEGYRYWADTSSDLIMDYVGAIFGGFYGFWLLQKNNGK